MFATAAPRTILATGRLAAVLTVAAMAAGVGCGAGDFRFDTSNGETSVARPQLVTLFEMYDALKANNRGVAQSTSFPLGIAPDTILTSTPAGATLNVLPAFSEGDAAAYVMPEIWVNYDEVWVQPWYWQVTAWNEKSPTSARLKDSMGANAPAVFDVGPKSLFYNPLWVLLYVVVPEGTGANHYTSSEQFFNENLPIYTGPPWTFSVRPENVTLPAGKIFHPYIADKEIGTNLKNGPVSYFDGNTIAFLDEGASNFKYDKRLVAEEVPLFVLATRDRNGSPVPMGVPNVMGSGPLFARRAADASGGRPRFGAYSRMHFAVITSATAAAFDPDKYPEASDVLRAKMLDPQAFRGRVALNGEKVAANDKSCFAQPEFPMGCTWMDSQARIEDSLGATNIFRTEISACTPLVFYAGKGIGR